MIETLAEPPAAATGFQRQAIRSDAAGLAVVRAAGLDDPELLADLAQIARDGGQVPLFQSHAWLKGVAEHLAPIAGGDVRILRLVDPASGRAVVILPMIVAREGRLKVARLLGDGVCDVLGAIVAPHVAATPELAETVLRLISAELDDADILRLTHLAPETDERANLLALAGDSFVSDDATYPVDLARDGATSVSTRSAYKTYQKQWRKLERRGGIRVNWLADEAEITAGYERMLIIRRERFARLSRTDVLHEEALARFYLAMLLAPAGERRGYLAELVVADKPVGYLYRVDDGRRFSTVICAIDDSAGNAYAPGLLLFTKLFEKATNEGYAAGDMGVGYLPYKSRFASSERRLLGLERGLTMKGVAVVAGAALLRRVKAWAKRQPLVVRLHERLTAARAATAKAAGPSEPESE